MIKGDVDNEQALVVLRMLFLFDILCPVIFSETCKFGGKLVTNARHSNDLTMYQLEVPHHCKRYILLLFIIIFVKFKIKSNPDNLHIFLASLRILQCGWGSGWHWNGSSHVLWWVHKKVSHLTRYCFRTTTIKCAGYIFLRWKPQQRHHCKLQLLQCHSKGPVVLFCQEFIVATAWYLISGCWICCNKFSFLKSVVISVYFLLSPIITLLLYITSCKLPLPKHYRNGRFVSLSVTVEHHVLCTREMSPSTYFYFLRFNL